MTTNGDSGSAEDSGATSSSAPVIPAAVMAVSSDLVAMPLLPQGGEVFVGPGAKKEAQILGLGLKKLRSRDQDDVQNAKRYAIEQSAKIIMKRQQESHQQNQLKQQMYSQALSLMGRLYVGSISFEVREGDVKKAFENFGPLKSINMSYDNTTGFHKGFAFLEYEVPESAMLARGAMDGLMMGGRQLKLGPPGNLAQAQCIIDMIMTDAYKYNRVFVASVHPDLSEEDLKSVFEAFGEVSKCQLARNPGAGKGAHRGFGYIEFTTKQASLEAIAGMNMFDLGGQFLRVGKCITPPEALHYLMPQTTGALPSAAAMAAANITAKIQAHEMSQAAKLARSGGSSGNLAIEGKKDDSPAPLAIEWDSKEGLYVEVKRKEEPLAITNGGAASPSTTAPPPPPIKEEVAPSPPPPRAPAGGSSVPLPRLPPPPPPPKGVHTGPPRGPPPPGLPPSMRKPEPLAIMGADAPAEPSRRSGFGVAGVPAIGKTATKAAAPGLFDPMSGAIYATCMDEDEPSKKKKKRDRSKKGLSILDRISVPTLQNDKMAEFGELEEHVRYKDPSLEQPEEQLMLLGSKEGDIASMALSLIDGNRALIAAMKRKEERKKDESDGTVRKRKKERRKGQPKGNKGPKLNTAKELAAAVIAGNLTTNIVNTEAASEEASLISQERGQTIRGNDARYSLMTKLMKTNRSNVIMLKNMVTPDDIDEFLEDEIKEECGKYGSVEEVVIASDPEAGTAKVFVQYRDPVQADEGRKALHDRFFNGRTIVAATYDQIMFEHADFSG